MAEPQGKPKNTGVGSLSLLQQIFQTEKLNWGLLHCRRILYQVSFEGSPGRPGFNPWLGKIPGRRERLPIPVSWPGEFHGLHSSWGHKELDTTEQLSVSLSIPFRIILFF